MKTINVQFRYSVLHALASFQEAVKVMRWKEDLLDPPLSVLCMQSLGQSCG